MTLTPLFVLLGVIVVPTVFVLLVMYVLTPLARGLGWLIANGFRGIGWFIAHIFEFVAGMLGDTFRFISTVPALLVLAVMTLFSVALGRWSSAAHFGRSIRREFVTAGTCLYGFALRRPLKLVWLHGMLEGVEQRVPEAMAAAPGRDRPTRSNQFDGYTIVGSLPSGGSGAKLYVAEPDAKTRGRVRGMPEQVVIKSFTLEEGSALPQIVRESRALESAKKLGAVYEHGMDSRRFWYAMPYYRGDHLGIITRQLHAESGSEGLDVRRLKTGVGYVADLAGTLLSYHREGLWHKDVKPENVIIGDGTAHLVDLGLVTPLHSAMTLTTHGTEYFRDPELVRQALRGVKVHQVDGAKFDVFGIGAVLYFLIENDFPAHGPLSRFRKKSPDAIKWIVRRAMADYHHRYDSADALVADLRVVADARDPFAVKPAQLPSVLARSTPDDGVTLDDPVVEGVDGPMPGAGAGVGAAAAAAGAAAVGEAASSARPKIRRKGFFSGAYEVMKSPDAAVKAVSQTLDDTIKAVDDAIEGRGADVTVIGFGVGTGASKSARVRAKKVRRDAQRRMKDAKRRAASAMANARKGRHAATPASRHAMKSAKRPVFQGLFTAMALAITIAGTMLLLTVIDDGGDGRGGDDAVSSTTRGESSRPAIALLVGESVRGLDESHRMVDRIVADREVEGYEVVRLPDSATDELIEAVLRWELSNRSSEADELLEDQLEAWGLYGVLDLQPGVRGSIGDRLVHSTRNDARSRVPLTRLIDLPDPSLPLLLVNDHPRYIAPAVVSRIDQMVSSLSELGWTVTRDPEVEADLRTVLPIRSDAEDVPMTPVLAEKIADNELGAVLRVIGFPGDDDRIMLQIVRPDEVRARTLPMPPMPPAVPGDDASSRAEIDGPASATAMRSQPRLALPGGHLVASPAPPARGARRESFAGINVFGSRH